MPCWKNLPEKFIERVNHIVDKSKQLEVLESFCRSKPVSVRINPLKTNLRSVADELISNNITTRKITWYKDGLIIDLDDKQKLTPLQIYKDGHFYIQNLTSMIPALILDPKINENILDLTAAPGSKTTQMAQLMANGGSIVANDISPKRLFKLKSILNNQGVTNVKITQIPGEYMYKKYPNYFDKVLLDAPCTMEGRFKANDSRTYKDWSLKKIKVLSFLQKRLLKSAFYAAKPGGIIIYSTCTISPEENEEVIEEILNHEGKHIRLEKIAIPEIENYTLKSWKKHIFKEELNKTFRILPSENTEGFFVAKIRRLS